ncbi:MULTISPECIES: type VI secretion system baseplate subunit TssF [Paraburkholderia]|uniref:Type VI secretion system protein ImpG n=1 Tax=Paraburkholderia tuberum TaxID=157910 RepID=A0A1H1K8P1_9BURK|nr:MULTISPECIES: type VI secretion system baseplate subunit TssF [Paraburkholderia]MBB5410105.1 type VI secretion system protein ImpG [Paraburkholderia sp. HC6.4b]MBB5451980.1 type VI secretion system protein ImpG [Paraburkholderia sp. Kb1A]MBC8723509.1 type VI secretion system baseplate subunit TssF [Paraburkholderia sp. 31.1]MBC8728640.1 type VI secretion system baseplate subunit TssF [Paraburkholderia sp. UCT2]SDR58653.1 type VI secretion system protein ImpG [Paraburkholderia tuberum]
MDPRFLDYYSRELTYMREMAGEFAAQHPKIARRLGMEGIDVADPYVERLIEAFCFMSARTQIKLDAEFPRFTQRLLEVVYPNYVAPTPSIAVAQLRPSLREGDFTRGLKVPRQSMLRSAIPPGEQTACEFRSSQDVTLWPIEIAEARLSAVPPDIPDTDRHLLPHLQLRGALRLRLRTTGEVKFNQMTDFDRLPIYIGGDERIASHLFELIHAGSVASVVRAYGASRDEGHVVAKTPVEFEGLQAQQGLLPLTWNTFHGHNLLQEYFACRQRFYFFALTQLAAGLARVDSKEAEVVLLLDRLPEELAAHVDAARFLLFCTPVINLFRKRTDRVEINRAQTDFHLLADRTRPLDYEIFSVSRVFGQRAQTSLEVEFNPLYQTLHSDVGNHGRYFSVRREQRALSANARKYGTRTPYIGTEVYVSLVDQAEAPYADDIRYLSVEAWVTNRDLPRLIPRNGKTDLTMSDSVPIEGVRLVHAPSAPRAPYASGETAWRLIRQLSFNYMPLAELDHGDGGQALRNMLGLFIAPGEREQARQIEALVGARTEPVVRRLPGDGLLVYGRGVRCELTVDETGFSGISPYLLGLVLEHYLARHVSINVFTETELRSMQRGLITQWRPRMGGRGAV